MIMTTKSIKIWCNTVHGGWSPQQAFLAGTENFVRQFAEESVKRGYETTVYQNGYTGIFNGVFYRPHNQLDTSCDTFLIVKEPTLLDIPFKAKRVLFYTNDIEDGERLTPERLKKITKVLALSKYHRDYLLMGIPNVQVISHGITRKEGPYTKEPFLCLYASSPDRGLQQLLTMWPSLKKKVPQANLEIAYNGKSEEEMEELYSKADYWLYPCRGIELYCITGIRAQAHGCIPIVTPHMALSETVKYGHKVKLENYLETAIKVMTTPIIRQKDTNERDLMITHSWPTPQSEWDEIMV